MVNRLPTPSSWPAILLERADAADPTDLDAAAAAGAFEALRRAIRDLGATGTIATVAASGLRGRGGAGFPTGEKWRAAAAVEAPRRSVVANGYGADPATFTDRALLELDPYAVVEGTAIAAFAIGASEAFIAVRAEQVEAIRRLEAAIASAEEAGFLGMDVHGSGHDIDVRVRPVQGAYMLGEETVLLKALEGRRVGVVALDVGQSGGEPGEDLVVGLLHGRVDRLARVAAQRLVVPVVDRDADDRRLQLARGLQPVQRPEGHFLREVAADAEDREHAGGAVRLVRGGLPHRRAGYPLAPSPWGEGTFEIHASALTHPWGV